MSKIFAVESVCSFYEVNLVKADSIEEAIEISQHSDYNASKYLGRNVSSVIEYTETERNRYSQIDDYFFDGYSEVDDDGNLIYKKMDGTFNGNMPVTKIK